jgi:hypothetical protein
MESSLTDEEEVGEKPHSDGDSHRIVSHMNEDDEKLKNFHHREGGWEYCSDHWRSQDIPTKQSRRG